MTVENQPMTEYECPECGELIEPVYGDEEVFCPECGAQLDLPDATIAQAASGSDSLFPQEVLMEDSRPSRFQRLKSAGGALGIGVVVLLCFAGGFALHVWTTFLVGDHWGPGWAIVAFCTPFVAEAVAMVACFWWGVWFYILAVGGWISAAVCLDLAERPGMLASLVVVAVLLAGSFTYFAIEHAVGPRPVTAELRKELEDVSAAFCAVLTASTSADPVAATNMVEVKSQLRKKLADYDDNSKAEIRRWVDSYLRFYLLIVDDVRSHLKTQEQTGKASFLISARTRQAMDGLPGRLKAELGPDQIKLLENLVTEQVLSRFRHLVQTEGEFTASRGLEALGAISDGQWRVYRQVYEDLLGCPMPSQSRLRAEAVDTP